jgi:hypothetical protein
MLLSCLPCGDEKDCNMARAVEQVAIKIDHPDQQNDTESCSPFCICACCGSTIVFSFQSVPLITEHLFSFLPSTQRLIGYYGLFFSNYYGNIWQPPKTSFS